MRPTDEMLEGPPVDRITLVVACTLTVDPKSMHVLIGHQSGGEPCSFTVPGERQPQAYRSAQGGLCSKHTGALLQATPSASDWQLSGLSRHSQLRDAHALPEHLHGGATYHAVVGQCKLDPHFAADSKHCAIAGYHGSWDRPDNKFADGVLTSVAKGDAPHVDVPGDIGDRSNDVGLTRALPVRAFPRHARLLATNNSRAGRARRFPQGGASSAAAVQAVGMQIGRRSPAS
jgi:hypothetical protein